MISAKVSAEMNSWGVHACVLLLAATAVFAGVRDRLGGCGICLKVQVGLGVLWAVEAADESLEASL